MNEHEAERIAAAMHQLRPDWPSASVLTLIRKNLIDRPRRDVTVALSWVACESGSHTPARVLETGPWWKAAGVEGDTTSGTSAGKPPWCMNCGCGADAPIHRSGQCEFTMWHHDYRKARKAERMAELRAAVSENRATPPLSLVKDDPTTCEADGCVRGIGHTGPHQGPPPMREPDPDPAPPPEPAAEVEEDVEDGVFSDPQIHHLLTRTAEQQQDPEVAAVES